MYSVDFESIVAQSVGNALPGDAMSANSFGSLDIEDAVREAGIGTYHDKLVALAGPRGAIDWSRFDIVELAPLMPSIATLDYSITRDDPDFTYRFVGESINAIAKRNLRGLGLRDVLVGKNRDSIIAEYGAALKGGRPRASAGKVVISELTWVRYLRFLYPVRTDTGVDRVLLIMLFDSAVSRTV